MSEEFTLPPPGIGRVEIMNLGPVIDPKFTDARDWSEFLPQIEKTPVQFDEHDMRAFDDAAAAAPEIALAATDVGELLNGKRYAVLSVGTRALADDSEHSVVVIYNYSDDTVVEAITDTTERNVVSVTTSTTSQPPVSAAEEQRAIELARQVGLLADNGIDVDTGAGLIVEEVDSRSPRYGHRLVDLRFGPADRRLPTAFAIVDLSAEEIVESGLVPRERS
ncbi:hypothetical protein [Nocardia nepalensis]|uniref:hypothetical protein n=1 Tax=Nocardia nepalensis TaxID=3375448 RepID=UPI003B66B819